MPDQFITELNLINHSNELSKAEEHINTLKNRFKIIQDENSITDKNHGILYEKVIIVLDYVGRLSASPFTLETKLEEMYLSKYPDSPKLAKQLWLEHYEKIHYPYNILKNRCHKMLDDLDKEYQKKFGKNPPNWNI
jgi:hypothetical protein